MIDVGFSSRSDLLKRIAELRRERVMMKLSGKANSALFRSNRKELPRLMTILNSVYRVR